MLYPVLENSNKCGCSCESGKRIAIDEPIQRPAASKKCATFSDHRRYRSVFNLASAIFCLPVRLRLLLSFHIARTAQNILMRVHFVLQTDGLSGFHLQTLQVKNFHQSYKVEVGIGAENLKRGELGMLFH